MKIAEATQAKTDRGYLAVATLSRGSTAVTLLIITVTLATLWILGSAQYFLVCDMECGETLLAIRAADHFAAHGLRYGLLEVAGDEDKPLIYAHNVNIGGLTFVLLQSLGVENLAYKTLLPLTAYGFGLFYMFLIVRQVTQSATVGLVTLAVFAVTYWPVGAFAMNALRAWHILGFFAVVFHIHNLIDPRGRLDPRHWLGVLVGAVVAFGCGYDFWIICGSVALAQLLIQSRFPLRVALRAAVLTGVAFAAPFVLRQIHVAYVLGTAFWWQDVLYTIAIKVPYASKLIRLPPLEQVDAWYTAHNVLRPPAHPTNSFLQILNTLQHMIAAVTLPRWGWLTLLTLPATLLAAISPRLRASTPGVVGATLLVPMVIGSTVGLMILAPFSLHVYFKHEFPLVAFPLLLAKGAVIGWCVEIIRNGRKLSIVAGMVAALYILDMAMVHRNNTKNGPYLNLGWVKFVLDNPDGEFLLATFNPALSRALPMLDKLNVRYIRQEDVIEQLKKPRHGRHYLVYQPIERFVDFDSAVPRCAWRDWITMLLKDPPAPSMHMNCIHGTPLPPDARPQPSLDEIARLGRVVERSDGGVGYVIIGLP